jgi:hypothetical protein
MCAQLIDEARFRKPGDAAGERTEGIIRTDDHQRSRKRWLAIPSTQPEPGLDRTGREAISTTATTKEQASECGYDSKDDHPFAMRHAAMSTPGFSDHPVLILVSTYLKGAHPEPGRFCPRLTLPKIAIDQAAVETGWAIPKPQQMGRSARCDQ